MKAAATATTATTATTKVLDAETIKINLGLILRNHNATEDNMADPLTLRQVENLVSGAHVKEWMGLLNEMGFNPDTKDTTGLVYVHPSTPITVDFKLATGLNHDDKTTFKTQLTTAIQAVLQANYDIWNSSDSPTGELAREVGRELVAN